jgi:lysophospholipase L1-like esterase
LAGVSGVLGLGDSVTVGANCGCTPFVNLLATRLGKAKARAFGVTNEARNGLTSDGLLSQLRSSRERAAVSQVTLVTIGANDFDASQLSSPGCTAPDLACYQAGLASLRVNMDALLDTLLAGGPPHGPVLVTGYWNVMLDGDVGAARGPAYQRDSDALTRQVNTVLQQAALRKGVTYVDLYAPFKEPNDGDDTPLLAPDGDHPSAAGHALITDALMTALKGG